METIFEQLTEEYRQDVMAIFNYYAQNSYAAYPETELPSEFFHMFLDNAKKYPTYVMKTAGSDTVVGFCLLRSFNPFSTFKETAEISYFIEEKYVGNGIGKAALAKLEAEAKKLGIKNILASISSENESSLAFHNKHGFSECGRMREVGKKFGKNFDVVWMQKRI